MRLAALLSLLPALVAAQDVPSLQRPNPALPITEEVPRLVSRLGRPGGSFAAAQLALKGERGTDALRAAKDDPDPLRRLDAAYGLGLAGTYAGYAGLALFLADSDPRVAEEADHGFRIAGTDAFAPLQSAAIGNAPPAADRAAETLKRFGEPTVRHIAGLPYAGGRAGAIRAMDLSSARDLRLFEEAAHDPRAAVRFEAARRIVFAPKTAQRAAALRRLARSPKPAVRLSLVRAMDEDPGSSLDPIYERAQRYGPVGSRRIFARMVTDALYDRSRMLDATAILARLANDPAPTVGDAAVEELYAFLSDRLGSVSYGSSGPSDAEDVPWDRLSPTTVSLLRRGAGERLRGPLAFKASVVLARLRDRRAYPALTRVAFGPEGAGDRTIALLALGTSRDRRATPRMVARAQAHPDDFVVFDALGRLGDPTAIPALLALARVNDPSRGISGTSALYALAAIGDRSAVRPLIEIAKEGPWLGLNAYIPIARLGGTDAARFFLDRLENDPEDRLQYVSAALGEMRDPEVVTELKRIAAKGGARGSRADEALRTIAYRAQERVSRA